MKCTKCGIREATTEVIRRRNNIVEKMYLCDECAQDISPEVGFDDFNVLNSVINGSPMGLLSNLSDIFKSPSERTLICPDCKTTSAEFIKTGFVGCPRCYEVFEPMIVQTVKKLQQSDRHVGKVPIGFSVESNDPEKLKAELQKAVDEGDYDKAGVITAKLMKLKRDGDRT